MSLADEIISVRGLTSKDMESIVARVKAACEPDYVSSLRYATGCMNQRVIAWDLADPKRPSIQRQQRFSR